MSSREQPPELSLKELDIYHNYFLFVLFYSLGGGEETEGGGEWDGSGSHDHERPNVYRLAVLLIMPRWPVKGKF